MTIGPRKRKGWSVGFLFSSCTRVFLAALAFIMLTSMFPCTPNIGSLCKNDAAEASTAMSELPPFWPHASSVQPLGLLWFYRPLRKNEGKFEVKMRERRKRRDRLKKRKCRLLWSKAAGRKRMVAQVAKEEPREGRRGAEPCVDVVSTRLNHYRSLSPLFPAVHSCHSEPVCGRPLYPWLFLILTSLAWVSSRFCLVETRNPTFSLADEHLECVVIFLPCLEKSQSFFSWFLLAIFSYFFRKTTFC